MVGFLTIYTTYGEGVAISAARPKFETFPYLPTHLLQCKQSTSNIQFIMEAQGISMHPVCVSARLTLLLRLL